MKSEEAIEILQKRIDLIKQDWTHMPVVRIAYH